MDDKEAMVIFENSTKERVARIERCGVGIGNYVFLVFTAAEKFVLRCSTEENAYKNTMYWLDKLSECEIPIPVVLSQGRYGDYSYLILSYLPGEDIGNVYFQLSGSEKRQIAKEVVAIQRKVSSLHFTAEAGWTWNRVVDEMLNRAEDRIKEKRYFGMDKISLTRGLREDIQEYLDQVPPTPYLDDISTKNLLIDKGKLSGIIDIDWMGFGDVLSFVAMTRVALLNMDLDTQYIDFLLNSVYIS